eukprot:TRINITY_DN664_c0_g1_i7.p1 TRINITY_DN664_c0_g1~~TRINITY_DN664_c0_g1_i7.p1  ORF type:complete len:676 (+),score=117.20 TRINITY_DN664_c0_g1_i7:84-2111(+)
MYKHVFTLICIILCFTMPVYCLEETTTTTTQTYQWIVVGAGCSGATLARKLLDYFPNDKVLLLERGIDNLDPVFTDETCSPEPHIFNTTRPVTCTYPAIIAPRRSVSPALGSHIFTSIPQPQLKNRTISFGAGNCTGGGTSINGMVAFRALREEFEEISATPGLEEFNYHAFLPYYKKIEDNENNNPKVFWDRNGNSGRVSVTNHKVGTLFNEKAFLKASIANGVYPSDINSLQLGGLSKAQATITSNGRRASSAINYLDSTARNSYRFTLKNTCRVRRILFNSAGTQATGVEYQTGNQIFTAFATKEIIISAGTVETPRILKSSGIGPSGELQALGIPVIRDMPVVGTNYFEKPLTLANFRLTIPDNPKMNTSIVLSNSTFRQWKYYGTGPLTGWNNPWAVHGGSSNLDAEFHEQAPLPDTTYNFTNWMRLVCWNAETKSRGSIQLNPSDIYGSPIIDVALLRDSSDADKLIACNYKFRKILKEAGIISDDLLPSTSVWENTTAFRDYVFSIVSATQHNCGTCRLGSNSSVAVVDGRHRVFGIQKLRIMDYSIFPYVLRVNPALTLYALSEKLADYIREDYQSSPPLGRVTLQFQCTPPVTAINDYSIWSVKNTYSKPYVYHWSSTTGVKGSFSVEAYSQSYFYTPVDSTQAVTLKINGVTISTKYATNATCPF